MISSILLAAGQSKRMNGQNKLTKEINGIPLIKYSINNILESDINELIIVVGHQNEIIKKNINNNPKIKIAFNQNYTDGMASSIKIGLNYLSKETETFFICLADMPFVDKNIYSQLIESRNNNKIIVPTYKNQQGNPVLFSISMKKKIMTIQGDIGAKKILEKNKRDIFNLKTKNRSVIQNFNTIDDFDLK
tara:strand:- start:2159 stop:2731 length:573 start_codon:yes stop_codon:yes gene_type:complete